MGKRSRFVKPETVRLELSDGDWIEVKKHLTAGEARKVAAEFIGRYLPDGSRVPNMDLLGFQGVLAYLVDWSFEDDGKRQPITIDTIKGLTPDDFKEIDEAIDKHIEAMTREIAEAKKASGGTAA
jgi:hypothetical protein